MVADVIRMQDFRLHRILPNRNPVAVLSDTEIRSKNARSEASRKLEDTFRHVRVQIDAAHGGLELLPEPDFPTYPQALQERVDYICGMLYANMGGKVDLDGFKEYIRQVITGKL